MASLTAASWTTTFINKSQIVGAPPKRTVIADLALAGTDTYPTGGIPLPSLALLGFKRNIDSIAVTGIDATGGTVSNYLCAYDQANHKLLMYSEEAVAAGGPLLQALSSEVPGPRTFRVEMIGW